MTIPSDLASFPYDSGNSPIERLILVHFGKIADVLTQKGTLFYPFFVQFTIFPLLIGLLLFPAPCLAWSASVSRIADGDTIIVERIGGQKVRIRLYGVDCPELDQPYGKEAKNFLESFLVNSTVAIEDVEIDRFGRLVALVYLGDGPTMQETLLEEGLAWVYPKYCKRAECLSWQKQEETARKLQRGLWESPDSVPPWVWRNRKKSYVLN